MDSLSSTRHVETLAVINQLSKQSKIERQKRLEVEYLYRLMLMNFKNEHLKRRRVEEQSYVLTKRMRDLHCPHHDDQCCCFLVPAMKHYLCPIAKPSPIKATSNENSHSHIQYQDWHTGTNKFKRTASQDSIDIEVRMLHLPAELNTDELQGQGNMNVNFLKALDIS